MRKARFVVVSGVLFMTQPDGFCFGWTKDRRLAVTFDGPTARLYASCFWGGGVVQA